MTGEDTPDGSPDDPGDTPAETDRLGKVDDDFFADLIAPELGADREDVRLGPAHGVDFGVVDIGRGGGTAGGSGANAGGGGANAGGGGANAGGGGSNTGDGGANAGGGQALVTATDPLSLLPALGFERAGRFAVSFAISDVAVSGVAPPHVAVSLSLPTEMDESAFASFWQGLTSECAELGVAVVTGHTAQYPAASYPWVGATTVFGVGDHDDVIRPDGARPGDDLVVTEGPAVETAGLLATLFPAEFDALGAETVADAQACLNRTGVTRDARAAVEAARAEHETSAAAGDVTDAPIPASAATDAPIAAMHDATEGGLRGALCETAAASGVRLDVDRDRVPTDPAALAVTDHLGIDPWACTTAGSLLLSVDPAATETVVSALESRGTPAAAAGTVREGSGVSVDGERVRPPEEDPSWAAWAALGDD